MPAYREGKKRSYMGLEFYACNGMIRLQDGRDGTVKDISASQMLERAFAVAKEITRIGPEQPDAYRTKYTLAKMANEFEECSREAVAMGDPLDTQVQAYWRRHKSWKTPTVPVEGMPSVRQRPSGLLIHGQNP